MFLEAYFFVFLASLWDPRGQMVTLVLLWLKHCVAQAQMANKVCLTFHFSSLGNYSNLVLLLPALSSSCFA